jgi:hypothetical protein
LSLRGLSLRGLELNSLDDFAHQVRSGERPTPAVVFFPMHRVERIELDASNGEISSLAEQFAAKAGCSASAIFGAADLSRARKSAGGGAP